MTDRGVSEVLGFVLVFALVIGTIGMVYATGFSGLQDARDAERVNNVERAFDVLADNLEDLHRSGVPSRATEVKLAGGSLRTGEPVTIEVRAEDADNSSHNETYSTEIEPIVYEDDGGTSLIYSNGALIRSDPTGAVMLGEPGWVIGPNRSSIPFVTSYGTGGGVGGEGTVLIVAERGSRNLRGHFEPETGPKANVSVTVSSPRAATWQRFMENRNLDVIDDDPSDGNVTYQFQTETLYVPRTGIEVTFNR